MLMDFPEQTLLFNLVSESLDSPDENRFRQRDRDPGERQHDAESQNRGTCGELVRGIAMVLDQGASIDGKTRAGRRAIVAANMERS